MSSKSEGVKTFWMLQGDHRIACAKHRTQRMHEVEAGETANCWWCLREIGSPA